MGEDVIEWSIPGADGEPILGNTHRLPGSGGAAVGALIICHGFKGYKDYGFLPRLAEAAADAGLVAHRFNFSHSGMTRNVATFERPELFELDTWGKQVEDLRRVLEHFAGEGLPTVVFGHSRGGVTALLTAARLEAGGGPKLAGVVTAASPADTQRLTEEQAEILRRAGRMASPSGRTGQTLYVGAGWLEEIEADAASGAGVLDPLRAAGALTVPLLQLHGDADETVPVLDLTRYGDAAPAGERVVIEGATHGFNAPNPMPALDEQPPVAQAAELLERVVGFARRCCGG